MNIKHGMVLAAGLGKRMQPLTLKTPKPLLEINNISLIERAINLLVNHGVTEISINIHYLPEQIQSFLKNKNFKTKISISSEVDLLLDTGGGVLEGTKNFNDNPFFVINPDTVWSKRYLEEIKNLYLYDFGIYIDSIPVPLNALVPILLSLPSSIIILFILVQPSNALSPTSVTDAGI